MGLFCVYLSFCLKFGRCLPWCMKCKIMVKSYNISLLFWPTMSDRNGEVVKDIGHSIPSKICIEKMSLTLNVNKSIMKGGREDVDTPFWS